VLESDKRNASGTFAVGVETTQRTMLSMTRKSHICFIIEPAAAALLATESSAMNWDSVAGNGRQTKPVYGQPSTEVSS
jgi:hypothetical protein